MAVIETWLKTDLKSIVKVTPLSGILFSQDNMANLIGVELLDGGQPATVTGSVSANVLRANGTTVAVAGTLSGNRASITLPQAAYAYPGMVAIVIKLTSDSVVTTIGAIQAVVYRSSTDTIVDPGTIIPDIQTLIAAIDAAVASIPPDYSELTGEVSDLKNAFANSNTHSGGNIFALMEPVQLNKQGINYVRNTDGSYTVSGTATGSSFCSIYMNNAAIPDGIVANRTYDLTYTSTNVNFRIYKYAGQSTTLLVDTKSSTKITFTETDLSDGMLIRLFVVNGTTVNETVKPIMYGGLSSNELEEYTDNLTDTITDHIISQNTNEIRPNLAEPFYIKASTQITGKYILCSDFNKITLSEGSDANSTITDYVAVMPGDTVIIRAKAQYSSVAYVIYDINKKPIYVYPESAPGSTAVDMMFVEVTIPENGFYIRASGLTVNNTVIYKKDTAKLQNWINKLKQETVSGAWVSDEFDVTNSMYLSFYGVPTSGSPAALSDYIPVSANEDVLVTGKCADGARLIGFYDSSKNYIGCYPDVTQQTPTIIASDLLVTIPSSAAYIRISAVYSTTLALKRRQTVADVISRDILFGKSLYCMGDSFTAGDFTGYVDDQGHTGTDSDAYSHEYNSYKTYPYWIAYRNNMELHNLAHIGWKVSHIVNNETYKQIPEDADYAFINIGLNDNSAQTPVGTIDSTDASTFYGGMNVILTWIRQNRPWLHFGILIVSAYLGNQYRTALENLATKYGYPYLNMWTDTKVPAWMGKDGMDATLSAELTAKAAVSETNGHPNLTVHKFISGFTEAFVRET